MLTKVIAETDDISVELNNTFLYCKETGEGIIKQDLTNLTTTNYSFRNVIDELKELNYDSLVATGLNAILFENGVITISELVEEKLKQELSLIDLETDKTNHINARRLVRKYFKDENLTSTVVAESSQMIM